MKTTPAVLPQPESSNLVVAISTPPVLFTQEMVSITKQEHIELTHQANYWQAQHSKAKEKITQLEQKVLCLEGKVKDLKNRLFGKHSEKSKYSGSSEKDEAVDPPKRPRGQQPNSKGHGRTTRPDLPVAT